jgi:ABC-type branched-subunit amino acid transport system substrate-binding protein
MAKVPTVFGVRPFLKNPRRPTGKYRYLFDQGVRKVALVYTAADAAMNQMQGQERPQMEASGLKIVLVQEVPLSTLSFDAAARAVANSGADYMLFLSDASYSASMARSMKDTGYKLKYADYIAAYGSNFIGLAGDAAEGSTNWIESLPDEEPGTVPEQTLYHRWMKYVAPDVRPDIFSVAAWAGVHVFMRGLRQLPGPITRDAVVASFRSIDTFDADGLIAPVKFGIQDKDRCGIAMRVEGGKWKRFAPAKGFLC